MEGSGGLEVVRQAHSVTLENATMHSTQMQPLWEYRRLSKQYEEAHMKTNTVQSTLCHLDKLISLLHWTQPKYNWIWCKLINEEKLCPKLNFAQMQPV